MDSYKSDFGSFCAKPIRCATDSVPVEKKNINKNDYNTAVFDIVLEAAK